MFFFIFLNRPQYVENEHWIYYAFNTIIFYFISESNTILIIHKKILKYELSTILSVDMYCDL